MTIALPRGVQIEILAHARDYPHVEVCGLVGARDGSPAQVYPVANVASEPARRFRMDPAGQIAAMRAMREAGQTLYALYHSHPAGPPHPSATDLAEAAYPEACYLIVSPDDTGAHRLHAFRLDTASRRFESVEITTTG